MNLSALEQALLPILAPGLESLWTNVLAPKVQAALQSASPEIQIVETGVSQLLNSVITAELQKLASI